jgi:hypothetical protein
VIDDILVWLWCSITRCEKSKDAPQPAPQKEAKKVVVVESKNETVPNKSNGSNATNATSEEKTEAKSEKKEEKKEEKKQEKKTGTEPEPKKDKTSNVLDDPSIKGEPTPLGSDED